MRKVLLLCIAGAAVSARAATPTEVRNKAIAKRVFEEIFNQGKFEVADEIYAPDFRNHGLHRDLARCACARWRPPSSIHLAAIGHLGDAAR